MAPSRFPSAIALLDHRTGRSRPRAYDHTAEDELKRLVGEVRAARQRLASLIATIKRERGRWPELEHRWEQWRAEMRGSRRSRIH
jgi:HPt (histidine-containing phosphotransfer) domain-containing protein